MILPLFPLVNTCRIDAWVGPWSPASVQDALAHVDQVSTFLVVTYTTSPEGKVVRQSQPSELKDLVKAAHQHGGKVLATFTNSGEDFDPVRFEKLMKDERSVKDAVHELGRLAQEDGFDGIDLDIESLKAADRVPFTGFVQALSSHLHKDHLRLSTTVHPKESEPGNWDGPQAQDWKALGAASDDFRIMCYDFSWTTSPAGPIAPDDWIRRVVKFALTTVEGSKLSLGVAWYGYDWSKKPTASLGFDELPKSPFTLDERSGERTYGGDIHFAAQESFTRKVALAQEFGLAGVSAWRIGLEDPEVWPHHPG